MQRVVILLLLLAPASLWGQEASPDTLAPSRQTGAYLLKACTASALTPSGRLRRQYCAGFLAGVEEYLRVVTPSDAEFCPPENVELPAELVDYAKSLDKHYILARYPNGFPSGAPTDFYTEAEAREAVRYAEAILEFCRRQIS